MAPMSTPMKRSTPSDSEEGSPKEEHVSKRRRVENDLPVTPPPESIIEERRERVKTFEDDPRQLLERSIVLALEHVGFEGAQRHALESFCSAVDSYATRFLSKVTSSMLDSRRAQPTPLDFEFALTQFGINTGGIEPHLTPPVDDPSIWVSKTQIRLEALPPEDLTVNDITKLIGNDLSGEPDKIHMPHIPKRFPSFPSKHTYKWTEKESARETDPRKIREEAAKAARQGEDALRRLTKVGKAGQEKDIKNAASKDSKTKQRHNMWEKTMKDLLMGKRSVVVLEEADRSMIVNADRSYCRKGQPAKRKPPAADILLPGTKT